MSSDVAIKVQNLSKCYQIYKNPKDRLKQFVLPRIKSILGLAPNQYFRAFWALNDVSFEIKRGDTVAIIGRNGSGKSTLLQLICGTLYPTLGTIQKNGRIAALLELGAGFNPEFTGRENVYMSGTLLGLTERDIDTRFSEIEAFADIGDLINQPVKTYSSGMYVRLAFAVIAHVDADILVIDEALAVGDAVFSQKCLRFLRNFQKCGTLIFVSHDMSSVVNLCQRAIWLNGGEIQEIGSAKETVEHYLQFTLQEIYGPTTKLKSITTDPELDGVDKQKLDMSGQGETHNLAINYASEIYIKNNLTHARGWKTGAGEITLVVLKHLYSSDTPILRGGELLKLTITAAIHEHIAQPVIGFLVRDRLGQDLFGENTLAATQATVLSCSRDHIIEGKFIFRLPMLPNGTYSLMASLAGGDLHENVQHHWLHDALLFDVQSSKVRWGLVGLSFEKVSLDFVQ